MMSFECQDKQVIHCGDNSNSYLSRSFKVVNRLIENFFKVCYSILKSFHIAQGRYNSLESLKTSMNFGDIRYLGTFKDQSCTDSFKVCQSL